MFVLLWKLSAAVSCYVRVYAPTNRAIDWLRTSNGLKWPIPVALVTTPAYLGLMWLAVEGASRQGLGWLNLLAILFYWNAMKFALMAALSAPLMLRTGIQRWRGRRACALAARPSVGTRARPGTGTTTGHRPHIPAGDQLRPDVFGPASPTS